MPRMESFALQAVEGKNATARATKSEDSLVASIERFSKYALKRKIRVIAASVGSEQPTRVRVRALSKKNRELVRESLRSLAESAT